MQCLCLLVGLSMSPHPSYQLSERSHLSTTALQCKVQGHWKTRSPTDKVIYQAVLDSSKSRRHPTNYHATNSHATNTDLQQSTSCHVLNSIHRHAVASLLSMCHKTSNKPSSAIINIKSVTLSTIISRGHIIQVSTTSVSQWVSDETFLWSGSGLMKM